MYLFTICVFLLGYCWEVLLLFRQNHIHLYLRDQGTKTFENMYAQIFSDLLIIYLAKAIIYKLLIITNSYFFLEMCMYVYFSFNFRTIPFAVALQPTVHNSLESIQVSIPNIQSKGPNQKQISITNTIISL